MPSKNLFIIISLFIVAIGCQSPDEPTDSSKVDKELRAVIKKIWADAVAGDLDALRSTHFDSPKFSKFGPRIAERQDVNSTNKS
ncbi:MAG: hypothetical protein WBH40_18880, partial [Ignavibacteriaceae bacterium]